MPQGLRYRLLLILGLALWGSVYLTPSFTAALPGWWPSFLPSHQIRLGRTPGQGAVYLYRLSRRPRNHTRHSGRTIHHPRTPNRRGIEW